MTDEDRKYTVDDLVTAAAAQQPLEFEAAFNDLIVDRIRSSIEDKKIEIAQQMYGYEPPLEFEQDLDATENDDEFGDADFGEDDSGYSEEE